MFPCFQTNVDVVILILQPWLLKVFISESLILATESDNSVRYQANKCWSWYQYLRRIQLCCLQADTCSSSSGSTCGQPYQLLWDGGSSIPFIWYCREICDMILQILMQFSYRCWDVKMKVTGKTGLTASLFCCLAVEDKNLRVGPKKPPGRSNSVKGRSKNIRVGQQPLGRSKTRVGQTRLRVKKHPDRSINLWLGL